MARITYIEPDGQRQELVIPDGWSVMEGAIDKGIEGIVAQCGGGCSCATCHVYVVSGAVDEPGEEELEMLEFVAAERKANSRLSCQLEVSPKLDGLVVQIPDTQY
ncbi:2Fe-2S iron-sulfur cluster-binding protein [Marinobacterium sedimentorum]|uniref:2Fe-2S iron-sulfur cluster-binding protein n=1 Tax=Marinobacterium sedimentorum TaxID=2927804 RepID=UPI0020C5FFEB|nr:2Fe-2S iron-sulfur cluster-binding protein [Marinobacterium sedimentorum]MCP8688799.1 2Fe-2S iron-sulfur cluster-binding protein [Marinobacterium sedimentorum]